MAQDNGQPAELDAGTVKKLLDRLENDDAFRARFEQSPAEALRLIGHHGGGNCMDLKGGKLASPEQIRAQREKLEQALTGVQKMACPLSSQEP